MAGPGNKRTAILQAAERLFAQRGYESTTMDAIANSAGVSKATLYRYFPSKGELRDLLAPRLPQADLQIHDARARILEAAVDTIGRKGYSRTTLDDIAAAAGVSKGGIYWHFKGKDDLMAAIVAEYSPFPRVVSIVEGAEGMPFEEVMQQIFDALLRFIDQHGGFFRAIISEIQTNPELGTVFQRNVAGPLIQVVGGYLTSQMARGGVRPLPPILLLQAVMGPLAVHMLTRSLVQQMGIQLDLAEVRDAFLGIFLDGIRSSPKEDHHASSGD